MAFAAWIYLRLQEIAVAKFMREIEEKPTCPKCDTELARNEKSPDFFSCPTESCGFYIQLAPGYSFVKIKRIL
jgi:hypothetical protein